MSISHRVRLCVLAILVTMAVSGCQTIGMEKSEQPQSANEFSVAKDSYNLFFDQKDHLKELMDAENFSDASILYEEQRGYFDSQKLEDEELAKTLSSLVTRLADPYQTQIEQALSSIRNVSWSSDQSRWHEIRKILDSADQLIAEVPSNGIFVNPVYRPDSLSGLQNEHTQLNSKISATASSDFDDFDHFSGNNFFAIHPSIRNAESFFSKNPSKLTALLSGRSPSQIKTFADSLGEDIFSAQQWTSIGNAYVEARTKTRSAGKQPLKEVLAIITDARAIGFSVDRLDSINISFVEITSRTLLKQGQIDFPAQVEVDLPFEISKAELESAFSSGSMAQADYLIVFDVALAKARRKVKRMQKHRSEMVVGYRQEANPQYGQMQNRVNMAQMAAQNETMNVTLQENRYCTGLACIAVAIAVNNAREKRDAAQANFQQAMRQLNATKPMINVPLIRPYTYEVGEIDAEKTMTVHYYVIDNTKKRYFKSTFDVVETERFGVAYQVASEDPNRAANIAKHDTEQDVSDWEKAPSSIKLSQLVDHYIANQAKAKKLKSLTALRREMLTDRNTAIAQYKENTFGESTANDPRFDSVVVIYTPDGGLGSGFFVRPDVVMTNYHVVGEGEFVELKMHDEQETFGKVIARDASLDLALVKVQSRGKPVKFYQGNKLELGKTVEVIGHPQRYEFSITRGVVSAVRKEKSPVLNAGPDILHVQIDAATSPGNSGGPVFMGDRVISVVSWGRTDRGSENLNFTVHHAEAQRFLSEALPGS